MNQLRADLYRLQAVHQWQREQFIREKGLLLSKKIHWARHTYGRLFRTLIEQGIDTQTLIDWLSREDGLKEFVFDLTDTGTAQPQRSSLEVLHEL